MSKMEIKKMVDKVAWCLENRLVTRSDDNILTLAVWANFYREDFVDMVITSCAYLEVSRPGALYGVDIGRMKDLPSSEAISRVRRMLNAEGRFLPEPGTIEMRKRKQYEIVEITNPGILSTL